MRKEFEIEVPPAYVKDFEYQKQLASKLLRINTEEINALKIIRRSIDARSKQPVFKLRVIAFIREVPVDESLPVHFQKIDERKKVIIIGSGPAGLFAALKLLEHGIKPLIFERGKDVRQRRFDIKAIMQNHIVNPDSNYCFGEGGAGTYSDGKLYTRSTKRGDVKNILSIFHLYGASAEIMIDAHPHIGSNKLPKIIQHFRETIITNGGEYYFNSRVTDFIFAGNKMRGVVINDSKEVTAGAVILATGHSARDIYYLLHKHKVLLEAKSFAMGVRIEHPQSIIDEIQYHSPRRHENLPASSYNLSCQVGDKGVYSFCMCPGGIIVPASTSQEEIVLNGMSVSRRDSPFANSGLVVSINQNDWKEYNEHSVFAGLEYQKALEKLVWIEGGRTQKAPSQRVTDFLNKKISPTLPKTSYQPGTVSSPLHEILPREISDKLISALKIFGNKMRGYITDEAQILAAETRTSSPIRIPRSNETLMHVNTEGLFPAGEGAGYAGGIVSAAIDGQRSAERAAAYVNANLA